MAQPFVKQLTTRHGPMLALPGDAYVTRCLEVYGEFSPGERALMEQLVAPGTVVVEVGANIGAHTVTLARACAPGPLYAFEPQQRVFQILCANLVLNGIENVVASPDACGAQPGEAMIPHMDYGRDGNFGAVSLNTEDPGGWPVRVVRIDDLNLASCRLIKIDVEGFEAEVLRGAAATLARHRPFLYVENDRREKQRELIALVHELGYRAYWHTPPIIQTDNFNGVRENVFGTNYLSVNMLCLPVEMTVQIDLEPIDPADPRLPGDLDPARGPVGGGR